MTAPSSLPGYLLSTAVQLASFPSGMWSLLSQRKLPAAPKQDDAWNAGAQTLLGGLIGLGSSAMIQNLQSQGVSALVTGAKLGLTEFNWSALGSAFATGAAVGACVGIATYLAREGQKAKVLHEERYSPSSQTNVALKKMEAYGPDSWAINRMLEKDSKVFPRLNAAILEHTMYTTHTSPDVAQTHTTVALGVALLAKAGQFVPAVAMAKQEWHGKACQTLGDFPSAQLLLQTLPALGELKSEISVLDMHSSWDAMVSQQLPATSKPAFDAALSQWTTNYFKDAAIAQVATHAFKAIEAMSKDSATVSKVQQEAAQSYAMVASMLLDTPVTPKVTVQTTPPAYEGNAPTLG